VEFDWSPIPPERWRTLLAAAPRANLLQSWPHAAAARMHDQMMSRRGLIRDHGQTLGILQIQEARLGPVHVLRLHRGPLWFDDAPTEAQWRGFLTAFNRSFPRRIGRWRQILPEMEAGEDTQALLQEAGLRLRNPEPYRTILLDLKPRPDAIRKGFKTKWRNALSQAERSGIEADCDVNALSAPQFLGAYADDKTARGYRGPKRARLATMIAAAAPSGDALILNAIEGRKTIAAILIFRHGNAATYQAGWTSVVGRAARAHHLLLWTAIRHLRAAGVTTLDLGGVHPGMAQGVTRFKQGLGGQAITLPGLYG